jgi:hypothetical protein
MAVSEGELYILDQQVPRLGWDNRPVTGPTGTTRQRWLVVASDGSKPFVRHLITTDAQEQFIRNDLLKDRPPWPAALPGQPGSAEEANGWNWTVLQGVSTLAS